MVAHRGGILVDWGVFVDPTTAAEPSVRTRLVACQARRNTNWLVEGIALARLITASWPANAAASADGSNSDTGTGVASCAVSTAALCGVRASAVTVCPARINAGTACPPIAPVPPVTNTRMASHTTTAAATAKPTQRGSASATATAVHVKPMTVSWALRLTVRRVRATARDVLQFQRPAV